MSTRSRVIGVLIVILGLALARTPWAAQSVQEPVITPSDDGSGYSVTIWPPNRHVVQVRLSDCVSSVVDAGGNPINVDAFGAIQRITSDEFATNSGGDMSIFSSSAAGLVAARDGSSNGRVYSILYEVVDQFGNSAEGLCRIQVPRNPGLVAIDSGIHECIGSGC